MLKASFAKLLVRVLRIISGGILLLALALCDNVFHFFSFHIHAICGLPAKPFSQTNHA